MHRNWTKILLAVSLSLNMLLFSGLAYLCYYNLNFSDVKNYLAGIPTGVQVAFINEPQEEVFVSELQEEAFINEPVVIFFASDAREILPVPEASGRIADICKTRLFVQPSLYRFKDNIYDCTQEGLYRFVLPPQEINNRIAYNGDMISLLKSVSWLCVHGNTDDGLGFDEKKTKLMNDRLYVTCGAANIFLRQLLAEFEIKSRLVMGATLDERNSYNNAHSMVEIYGSSGWFVVDMDSGVLFTSEGRYLNFIQLVDAIANGEEYEIVRLENASNIDLSGFIGEFGFNYSMLFETLYSDEVLLRRWYKRVLQVPTIRLNNGKYVFFSPEFQEKRMQQSKYYSPKHVYINEAEWKRIFYGQVL